MTENTDVEVFKIKDFVCECGYEMDATSPTILNQGKPGKGDVSICMRCGAIHLYETDLSQRTPTSDEMREIIGGSSWPIIQKARIAIAQSHANKS